MNIRKKSYQTMKPIILESIQDIENAIQYLDVKVIALRKSNKYQRFNSVIFEFYKMTIIPYQESRLDGIEMDSRQEKLIMDTILDFINLLNEIF
jgi:hypothetical protein